MAKDECSQASREKGFWFLLSAYIGTAVVTYGVFVLLLRVDARYYWGLLATSMLLSVPVALILQWQWRRRHPRVENTDEREQVIRGWARQVAGCTLLAVLCLACIVSSAVAREYCVQVVNVKVEWIMQIMIGALVVWEMGREIALGIAHRGERRRGKE